MSAKSGGAKPKKDDGEHLICRNARASQRYELSDRYEAGIVLVGSEVKSLRDKQGDLEGAYAGIERGELWLHNMQIAPYKQATAFFHEPKRSRKLLVHRSELEKLEGRLTIRGFTLVPTRAYFKNGRVKVELALARPRNTHDKREELKRDIDKREAQAAMAKARSR